MDDTLIAVSFAFVAALQDPTAAIDAAMVATRAMMAIVRSTADHSIVPAPRQTGELAAGGLISHRAIRQIIRGKHTTSTLRPMHSHGWPAVDRRRSGLESSASGLGLVFSRSLGSVR